LTGIFRMVLTYLMPLVSPMSVILAAGLLWKRTNAKVAWTALLSSYVVFLIWTVASLPYVGIVVPIFALLVVIIGSFVVKTGEEEQARIDGFFKFIDDNIKVGG